MNLAGYRKAKSLTQKDVAAYLGVTRSAVSKWESGKFFPRAETLARLAKLLGCKVDDLLFSASSDRR